MKTSVIVDTCFSRGQVDPRIFGSFVEHMGRVVYSGIYEPGHPCADENGFRTDVLAKTKKMGVRTVRYPGGNFVSNYNWLDGVGPKANRPKKRDLAWLSIETNEFGTDEFMKWAKTAGIEPIFAVNLGTAGINEALALLEYMNMPTGTFFSDMRAQNGHTDPYGIHTWCLGNEMDGKWQIGHKTAMEYGRLACETGKAMKLMDPTIELAVCGSSLSSNSTFGEWDRIILEQTYECADYISLHQYYGGQNEGTAAFLAQSLDLERYIKTVSGIADYVQVVHKSKKKINIALDEWGVWALSTPEVQASVEQQPWRTAPAFSEQIYTMEDALLFSSMLMAIIRAADRVKISCQSLLTNISACIMTKRNGESWLQTIYYPFEMMAKNAVGNVLDTPSSGPSYSTDEFTEVPIVDHLTILDKIEHELAVFTVNRSEQKQTFEVRLQNESTECIVEASVLASDDKKATNQIDHARVIPRKIENYSISEKNITLELLPLSFQMTRIKLYVLE